MVAVDGIQHDPVVAAPMNYRGQWQLRDTVLGCLDRTDIETHMLASALNPPQAGSICAGANRHPDVGWRDVASDVRAAHGKAPAPAVHHSKGAPVRNPRAPNAPADIRGRHRAGELVGGQIVD